MPPGPEDRARDKIDSLLKAAGWVIQDRDQFNLAAALGVAVREVELPSGPCDYLLFLDRKAVGVIEAKKAGTTLSGVAEQSSKYMSQLPPHLKGWGETLLIDYESTGEETIFCDWRDPFPRSRHALRLPQARGAPALISGRLDPPQPPDADAAARQARAPGLPDRRHHRPRCLARPRRSARAHSDGHGGGQDLHGLQLLLRLIKYARANRILFLVDRNNLGRQTLKEYREFRPPDDGRQFTDLYNVQHLASNRIDKDAKVVITTIQRLYAMLRGEELSPEEEEASAFEVSSDGEKRTVVYNPAIPIETFDFIVTDECHRSIYGTWRQVLEYFDAFIIGLTATPTKHTLGYFRQNLVSEYPEERSVADGINVPHEIYRVKTRISEQGATVEAGYTVGARDKRTRKVRYEELDDDLTYTAPELDRSVTAPNQIRTILETYKQRLFTELFPGREHVPKTLIFAKDDHHAEEIVLAAREVFGKGNDFAKKITYKAEGAETLIKEFRSSYNPRIAVTVDMIATGTDIKPLEVLIFMRDVKSETYYEQMKGRAIRSISVDDLQQVTPDADAKTRFLLIDAVGVTEGTKKVSRPMERKRTVAFGKLLELIAQGDRSEDTLSSTAARLAALDKKLNDDDRARIAAVAGGLSLRDLANALLDAIDPDKIEARRRRDMAARRATRKPRPSSTR